MSQYVLIKKLNVQNANAIAGLTYGFPAITNFLSFNENSFSSVEFSISKLTEVVTLCFLLRGQCLKCDRTFYS